MVSSVDRFIKLERETFSAAAASLKSFSSSTLQRKVKGLCCRGIALIQWRITKLKAAF
jgi:hypothetical protein